ncbi:13384_t:CDS:2, partial [Acaulospora colombiana]
GSQVDDEWQLREPYFEMWRPYPSTMGEYTEDIYAWEEPAANSPETKGKPLKGLRKLCQLKASLADIRPALQTSIGPGGTFWYLEFHIALHLRGSQLRVWMGWDEKVFSNRSSSIFDHSHVLRVCLDKDPYPFSLLLDIKSDRHLLVCVLLGTPRVSHTQVVMPMERKREFFNFPMNWLADSVDASKSLAVGLPASEPSMYKAIIDRSYAF